MKNEGCHHSRTKLKGRTRVNALASEREKQEDWKLRSVLTPTKVKEDKNSVTWQSPAHRGF